MKTKVFVLLCACALLMCCKDNNSASSGEVANQELPPSNLYYSYDYASRTAMVVKTPNDYPDDDLYWGYSDYSGDIVIPSSVIYRDVEHIVTGIQKGAFAGCENLRSIFIPATIDNIEQGTITFTPNLESIIVDPKNPIYDSRYKCNAIIETKTNTLIAGSNNTFIPSGILKIGPYALNGLSVDSLEIPEGLKEIEHFSLQHMANLKSITIPKTLETIGEDALAHCNSLKSVTIGPNVKLIVNAFLAGDKSLETISCLATTPPQWIYPSVQIPQTVILYVPDNSVTAYNNDEVWGKYFKDRIRPLSSKP